MTIYYLFVWFGEWGTSCKLNTIRPVMTKNADTKCDCLNWKRSEVKHLSFSFIGAVLLISSKTVCWDNQCIITWVVKKNEPAKIE